MKVKLIWNEWWRVINWYPGDKNEEFADMSSLLDNWLLTQRIHQEKTAEYLPQYVSVNVWAEGWRIIYFWA